MIIRLVEGEGGGYIGFGKLREGRRKQRRFGCSTRTMSGAVDADLDRRLCHSQYSCSSTVGSILAVISLLAKAMNLVESTMATMVRKGSIRW